MYISFCLCLVVNNFGYCDLCVLPPMPMHWHYDQKLDTPPSVVTCIQKLSKRAPPNNTMYPIHEKISFSANHPPKKYFYSLSIEIRSVWFSADIRKNIENPPYHDYVRCSRILSSKTLFFLSLSLSI